MSSDPAELELLEKIANAKMAGKENQYFETAVTLLNYYERKFESEKFKKFGEAVLHDFKEKKDWTRYYNIKFKIAEHEPGTKYGAYMVNWAIKKYENNVLAAVYWGAALLVVLIGLRAVGTGFIELPAPVLVAGLLIECSMIFSLGWFMWFKPEENSELKLKNVVASEQNISAKNAKDTQDVVEIIKSMDVNDDLFEIARIINEKINHVQEETKKLRKHQTV